MPPPNAPAALKITSRFKKLFASAPFTSTVKTGCVEFSDGGVCDIGRIMKHIDEEEVTMIININKRVIHMCCVPELHDENLNSKEDEAAQRLVWCDQNEHTLRRQLRGLTVSPEKTKKLLDMVNTIPPKCAWSVFVGDRDVRVSIKSGVVNEKFLREFKTKHCATRITFSYDRLNFFINKHKLFTGG